MWSAFLTCWYGEDWGTATGRIRTGDLRFTKPLLCQLSYGGSRFSSKDLWNCWRFATGPSAAMSCFNLKWRTGLPE